MTSRPTAAPTAWWDSDDAEEDTDPGTLAVWRRVIGRSGLIHDMSPQVRGEAAIVALDVARRVRRRERLAWSAGVARLFVEYLAVATAIAGFTRWRLPDNILVALVVVGADLCLLALAAAAPVWVRDRRRGEPAAMPRGRWTDVVAMSGIVVALSAVAIAVAVVTPAMVWRGDPPYVGWHDARLNWSLLPPWSLTGERTDRWSYGSPGDVGSGDLGAGGVGAVLVIGAVAAVLHLLWLLLTASWARWRQVRRERRDVVAGVLVPLVELLDLLMPDGALTLDRTTSRAANLLVRVAANLEQASPGSTYPSQVTRQELATQCHLHALDLTYPGEVPRTTAGEAPDPLQDARTFAANLLLRQLEVLEAVSRKPAGRLGPVSGAGRAAGADSATGRGLRDRAAQAASGVIRLGGGMDEREPRVPGLWRASSWPGVIPILGGTFVVATAVRVGGWQVRGLDLAELGGFVVVCGMLSTLGVDTVRALVPLRALYHRRRLRYWLVRRLGRLGPIATRQLEDLLAAEVTSRNPRRGPIITAPVNSTYNLPAEQLLAQVDLVVGHVVATDRRFAHVVNAFTVLEGDRSPRRDGLAGDQDALEQERSIRLASVVNQLQAWLTQGWQRQIRLASAWVSGAVAVALERSTGIGGQRHAVFVCGALVFGGIVAEAARDLVAAIRRLRGG